MRRPSWLPVHPGIRRRFRRIRHWFHLEPVRTTHYLGHPFVYPADSLIGKHIAQGLEWDAILRIVLRDLPMRDDAAICEVGSNIGASLLQILAAKPRARVTSIEPSQRFLPFLRRNLQLAGFPDIEILPLLLGRASGSAWLFNNSSTASIVGPKYDGHEPRGRQFSEMTTVDDLWRGRGPLDFLKLDTDGFDFEVLRGGVGILQRWRPALFLELAPHLLTHPTDDLTWLQSLGYDRLICLSPGGALAGETIDADQAIRWARANGYCDLLTSVRGSAAERSLTSFMTSGRALHA